MSNEIASIDTAKAKDLLSNSEAAHNLFIVGMGASAGGLEAFISFFDVMPADTGMAFILVSHLDPDHTSLLSELLQRHTDMPVRTIENGMKVQADHIYVIPPNKDLRIFNQVLQLFDLLQLHGANLPIDGFFRSLAEDQGANAISIVLSGTGTDGTLGIRAIKGELGLIIAQEETSAKYNGMPRSAIATGLVDHVLAPERMPETLIEYVNHKARTKHAILPEITVQLTDDLNKIFILLRKQTGHDFSLYKNNTIFRRIDRRMTLHKIDEISDYVQLLQQNTSEVDALFKELLIGVTSFFRDAEAFDALKNKALLELLKKKPDDYIFRVWVPACSTGEEVYSIAILLQECMKEIHRYFTVQIFGTDIDEAAITTARKGRYSANISADVTPERLAQFFRKEENGQYQISKAIREMVVFAPQNMIKDPPFTKLDLLCCRNLLIYFSSELQHKLLPVFHYSLKPEGILFLGTSETIGANKKLFASVDKNLRIFRCKTGASTLVEHFHPVSLTEGYGTKKQNITINRDKGLSSMNLIESILRASDTPPCVVIDDNSNIVYIHGKVGQYIELPEGSISLNILDMAHRGLKTVLASAIHNVVTNHAEFTQKDVRVNHNGRYVTLDLSVKPLLDEGLARKLMMVIFKEVEPALLSTADDILKSDKTTVELEQELQYTRQTLQSTIEASETTNEELTSSNEELQSTNEELQSMNEELETSREELQSLNEESITVNSELQNRVDELSHANDDVKNLLDSTEIATLFLDKELCIRRYTPKMTEIIPLAKIDIGRPLSDLASTLEDIDLNANASQVLVDLAISEIEVKSSNGHCYLLRIRPYRTIANVIDGIVMTFDDISNRLEAEIELKESKNQLALAFKATNDAVWDWDLKTGAILIDKGYSDLYGESHAKLEDVWQWRMDHIHPDDRDRVIASIQTVINADSEYWRESFRYRKEDDSYVMVIDRAYIFRDENGKASRLLGAMLNVSQFITN